MGGSGNGCIMATEMAEDLQSLACDSLQAAWISKLQCDLAPASKDLLKACPQSLTDSRQDWACMATRYAEPEADQLPLMHQTGMPYCRGCWTSFYGSPFGTTKAMHELVYI